ncbi:tol-pal system protein YbgF [Mesorhizobium sp. VNQ89]|uniref:tol-pal system protein YbgF n=1 Tax=Mesorhizobium quangtriensis TaxID=3157709 RepID=UPI0032B7D661
MYFRTILSGTLAILLVSGAVAQADERAGLFDAFKTAENAGGLSLPKIGLPKFFGSKEQPSASITVAQAGDPRITAMEEQLRSLSGTIEELNFQILQMQEQIRKMQEDNEFRFQELEQKKTDAGAPSDSNVASAPAAGQEIAPAPTDQAAVPAPAGQLADEENGSASVPMEPEVLVDNGTGDPAWSNSETGAANSADGLGAPPKTFGTITFDDKGNVTGGSDTDQTQSVQATGEISGATALPAPTGATAATTETQVAALPTTDSADELYRNSYEFILSGDYGTAEQGFRDHISRFPQDQKSADANFWLGEALLGQKKYRDAAEVFLAANKQFPSSKKAPDMLLKLGVSLVGLDQRDVACATFAEIGKKYPDASGVLKERVKQEQALASC